MNRIYRTIWNEQTGTVVAVSEHANAAGKKSSPRTGTVASGARFGLKALAVWTILAFASPLYANPTGGTVAAGSATIAGGAGSMTVTQASQNAVINWQSFSIGSGERVAFVQPNASSVALNRVLGADPSSILGTLSANGRVFLVNPNGILFGRGASVNVGALVASTLDITNSDFMSGNYKFAGASNAKVENQGTINAPGGYVALLGAKVSNEGIITARLGTVALAAGNAVTLDVAGDGLLNVAVAQGDVNALVQNGGLIQADGGNVLLTAQSAGQLLATVVNNTGVIQAQTVENRNGVIKLLGDMQSGTVNVAGTLDASAPNGGNGGFIETSAAHVKIAPDLRVTTAAAQGSTGTWLIDPQDYTIAASGGDITGTQLSSLLSGTSIEIQSSSGGSTGNGDIHVNDAVSWSANTLTLTAARDININAVMTASGSSALVMNTGTANGADAAVAGGAVNVGLNAGGFIGRVDFPGRSGTGFLTINGVGYTVINALGAEGSMTGTDLQGMQGNLAGHYALGGDIDASETSTWGSGWTGFRPVGNGYTVLTPFTGSFNGLGHTVSNLTTSINAVSYPIIFGGTGYSIWAGLFGATAPGSTIANVGLVGGGTGQPVIGGNDGTSDTGGLVGRNNGSIWNSYATRSLESSAEVGGLVGTNTGSIRNSFAGGAVSQLTNFAGAGGLVGFNSGNITGSHADGTVTGVGQVGGLVGSNSGTVGNSYATGAVSGAFSSYGVSGPVGGLVGANDGSITSSYATGAVTGGDSSPSPVGGLVGVNSGSVANSYVTGAVTGGASSSGAVGGLVGTNSGSVTNSYLTGAVSGGASSTGPVGALVGDNAGTVSNSHYDIDTVLIYGSHRVTYGGLYSAQYQDWFTHGLTLDIANYSASLPYNAASGYYEIGSVQGLKDLLGFAELAGLKFRLTGNLDLASAPGLYVPVFSATEFDGAGHVVSNLAIDQPSTRVGMFGLLASGSTLTGLGVANATVSGTSSVGGLVGCNDGSVANSYATGAASGTSGVGGLVGENTGSVTNSYAAATVNGGAGSGGVGGLVGSNYGSVTNSYATGAVSGGANSSGVGGLMGYSFGTVGSSYATGAVSGGANSSGVGGLMGYSFGTVGSSYATGAVSATGDRVGGLVGINYDSISDSYATGSVSGNSYVGGLVGHNYGTVGTSYATGLVTGGSAVGIGGLVGFNDGGSVTNSFWNTDTSGQTASDGGLGLTSAQMQAQANFTSATAANGNANPGWDVTGTWVMYEGHTAPLLRSFMTPLTVTANDASKTYDGLAYAGNNGVTYTGFVNGETASVLGGTLAYGGSAQGAVNAGGYALTAGGLYSNQRGYLITYVDGTLTVNQKALTVTGMTASGKVYDGTTTTTLSGGTLNGLVGTETLNFSGQSGTFADKNAGTGKAVSVSGITLADGTGLSSNYSVSNPTGLAADITPRALTVSGITASNKGYDGTTTALLGGGTLIGLVAGETLSFSTSGAFADKNVGTGKTVTVSGISLSDGTGLASNYSVSNPTGLAADITARSLTVTASGVNKIHDGTTMASVNLGDNRVAGDALNLSYTAANFADPDIGTGKTVSVSGIGVAGIDAGNYTLANTTASTTADITSVPAVNVAADVKGAIASTLSLTSSTPPPAPQSSALEPAGQSAPASMVRDLNLTVIGRGINLPLDAR